jgi:hypothetical protein
MGISKVQFDVGDYVRISSTDRSEYDKIGCIINRYILDGSIFYVVYFANNDINQFIASEIEISDGKSADDFNIILF